MFCFVSYIALFDLKIYWLTMHYSISYETNITYLKYTICAFEINIYIAVKTMFAETFGWLSVVRSFHFMTSFTAYPYQANKLCQIPKTSKNSWFAFYPALVMGCALLRILGFSGLSRCRTRWSGSWSRLLLQRTTVANPTVPTNGERQILPLTPSGCPPANASQPVKRKIDKYQTICQPQLGRN